MNRTNLILLALLVIQGACIGYQQLASTGPVEAGPRGLLLEGLDADGITELRIEEGGEPGDDKAVTLKKTPSGWVVGERWDHPADGDKVDELLRELAALEIADVVSQTGLHLVELGVAEDDFRKKVSLGGHVLYLGTSGRGSSTHTRVGGDDRVVAVRDFSTWRVNARPDSWVQRAVVDLDPEAVTGLSLRGEETLELRKQGPDWLVNEAPANAEEVDKLLQKAAKVSLSKVVGAGTAEGELMHVRVVTAEGVTSYRIAPSDEESRFLLAVDGGGHVLEVGKWAVEPLLDATAASLMAAIPMEAPEEPGQE